MVAAAAASKLSPPSEVRRGLGGGWLAPFCEPFQLDEANIEAPIWLNPLGETRPELDR